jgi:hypothetical protein
MRTTACIAVLASLLVMASVPAQAVDMTKTQKAMKHGGTCANCKADPDHTSNKGESPIHTGKNGDFGMPGNRTSGFDGSATYGSNGGPLGTHSAKEGGNAAGKKK